MKYRKIFTVYVEENLYGKKAPLRRGKVLVCVYIHIKVEARGVMIKNTVFRHFWHAAWKFS